MPLINCQLWSRNFQGVNILFLLSFENEDDRKSHSTNYLPKIEIKDYNVMIDGKNIFDQPINSNLTITLQNIQTYNNITKVATGQGDD